VCFSTGCREKSEKSWERIEFWSFRGMTILWAGDESFRFLMLPFVRGWKNLELLRSIANKTASFSTSPFTNSQNQLNLNSCFERISFRKTIKTSRKNLSSPSSMIGTHEHKTVGLAGQTLFLIFSSTQMCLRLKEATTST
jgi:hypothetical protein